MPVRAAIAPPPGSAASSPAVRCRSRCWRRPPRTPASPGPCWCPAKPSAPPYRLPRDPAPGLAEPGIVLATLKGAARRLRRWPAATLDRGCARCRCERRPGRRNGSSRPNQETQPHPLAAGTHLRPLTQQGAAGNDGTKVSAPARARAGTWIGTLRSVIALRSAPQCLEPDPRYPSGPAANAPHATGRIHDRSRSAAVYVSYLLPNGGRPYMTGGQAATPSTGAGGGRPRTISDAFSAIIIVVAYV